MTSVDEMGLVAGRACLDFANTRDQRARGSPGKLMDYPSLVRFSVRSGETSSSAAALLLRQALERPAEAAGVYHRAVVLRDAIDDVFSAALNEESPSADALEALNAEIARGLSQARLEAAAGSPGAFVWGWNRVPALDQPLWPLARGAGDLLVSADLARVGRCAGGDCRWLFLDESRNRSRRWCDMGDCGNRAKVRRHYLRHRKDDQH